ncbi:MAG: hypothetical protein ABMA13_18055 [Chthoniobacteraceae bacterium]
MRNTKLSIRKTRVNGRTFWRVTVPRLAGGRERRTFKSHEEAQTFFDLCQVEQRNHGTAALSISEGLRVEAVECSTLLEPFGKTLRDATKFYLNHLRAIQGSRTVREVVAELIAAREADGMAPRYVGDLRARLNRFAADFGDKTIAALSAKQITDWLRALSVGAVTRNSYRRRLAALFSFARRAGYASVNPMPDVEKAKERAGEIEILTVEETVRLLESASVETLPYWAIAAFTGVRPAEIERLSWDEIDREGGYVEVKAAMAKTASRRLVPIQPNLAAWLAPYAQAHGTICPTGLRKRLEADRERAGLRSEWPQNALRHGYGSYRLPILGDAGKLALEMGNSPTMVFRHYREVVKPREAERYWNIRPTRAKNVIALTA